MLFVDNSPNKSDINNVKAASEQPINSDQLIINFCKIIIILFYKKPDTYNITLKTQFDRE